MPRVAIIGSCITRDVWPIVGEAPPQDLLYISRTSLASLFAPPLNGVVVSEDPPASLGISTHRAMVADIRKTALAQLVAYRPTHLIFDFIDERFDLLAAQGTLVTHSWELDASGYHRQAPFNDAHAISRTSAACDLLWRQALRQMVDVLDMTPLGEAQLILHETQWASHYLDEAGGRQAFGDVEIFGGKLAAIADYNAILSQQQDAFSAALPRARRVCAPRPLQLADVRHRWGLSPFHYIEDYYRAVWREFQALGI